MRAYYRRFFVEDVKSWEFKGLVLFMGVANSDAKLYTTRSRSAGFPGQFRVDYALSQNNAKGGKMYIQDKVRSTRPGVPAAGRRRAHVFCGLKGMMPGILSMLEGVCKEKGINYEEWLEGLKEKGQWHVEVY